MKGFQISFLAVRGHGIAIKTILELEAELRGSIERGLASPGRPPEVSPSKTSTGLAGGN